MITTIFPLAAGAAVRLYLTPPPGVLHWRVLRKAGRTAEISDADDKRATVVADRSEDQCILDYLGLMNGQAYTWRAFYLLPDSSWRASPQMAATPEATYQEGGTDVVRMLRERVDVGMVAEVKRGNLKPASGEVPVITAPFIGSGEVTLPLVSVHFDAAQPVERTLGDELACIGGGDDDLTVGEGWLASHTLSISAASLNADERQALRQAILRILLANTDVFAAAGLVTPSWSWRDNERLPDREGGAVLFTADFTFTCIAPVLVTHELAAIRDVLVFPNPYNQEPTRGA